MASMKVMILAAGKGERMRPLTLHTPKPLLQVANTPLIVHHLHRLAQAGLHDIVINTAYLGHLIHTALGDGQRYGVRILYSHEGQHGLETAGGIHRALPLLGQQPFAVINADIWTDYPLEKLPKTLTGLAHLILVPNPQHHLKGDFALYNKQVMNQGQVMYTYAGLGVFHPKLFQDFHGGYAKLAPLLRTACERGLVTGEVYEGTWLDIGTPQRLNELRAQLGS